MPRYHIHTLEGGKAVHGSTVDLPDLDAAKAITSRFAGELLRDEDGGIFDRRITVEATDEHGQVLYSVTMVGETVLATPDQVGEADSRNEGT